MKEVKITKSKATPSTPKTKQTFEKSNHWVQTFNWNWLLSVSKKENNAIENQKIIRDQKREKFLIKTRLFELIADKTTTPSNGDIINKSSIT